MNRIILSAFFAVVVLFSCTSKAEKTNENPSVTLLRNQLKSIGSESILFGHQDDLAYGVGWKGIKGESDVKRTAGDYPALFGWEIGNVGDSANLDGVVFDSMVVYIQRVHEMGGINTISWHARYPVTNTDSWNTSNIDIPSLLHNGSNHQLFKAKLDLVAEFLHRLKDENGSLIPIIFRPWHEVLGGWFWWGSKTCTPKDYKELFRFTIDYLRHEKGLNNLLIAYSTSAGFDSRESYLKNYPGDAYVDVMGFDDYGNFTINRLDNIVKKMSIVVDLANEKNKISAFTETGSDQLKIPDWYSTNLLQVLKANEKTRSIAYVMVWRNRDIDHFYVPFPGHEQADDFRAFTNDKLLLLLDDYNKIKE